MVLYAKDIVEAEFLSLPPSSSVFDAAKQRARGHQGFVIITSPAKGPVGIVTEWEVLAKGVAEGRDPDRVPLGGITSTGFVAVEPNEGIDPVAQPPADAGN